jgi:hypothetical protein
MLYFEGHYGLMDAELMDAELTDAESLDAVD